MRQWKVVVNFWARVSSTKSTRLNKRIALWAFTKSDNCKNWYFCVKKMLRDLGLQDFCDISTPISKLHIVKRITEELMTRFVTDWRLSLNSSVGPSGRGHNKLRTYCTFKNEYKVEKYCTMILPRTHGAAYSKDVVWPQFALKQAA